MKLIKMLRLFFCDVGNQCLNLDNDGLSNNKYRSKVEEAPINVRTFIIMSGSITTKDLHVMMITCSLYSPSLLIRCTKYFPVLYQPYTFASL